MIRHLSCACFVVTLVGCQGYRPEPLDSIRHLSAWSARATDAESLRQYAERLGRPPTTLDATGDSLALPDAEVVALMYNPELRAARAGAAVALAGAENAGLWDDPSVSLDVMRVTESVPDPWVIGGAIGFTIPLSGRLGVEKALANAEHNLELTRVVEAEWATVVALRRNWAEWSAMQLQAIDLRELISRIDQVVAIVDRLEAAQSLSRLEGRLFRMERASRRSELLMVESRTDQLELQIKSQMGLVPEAVLTLMPQVAPGIPELQGDSPEMIEHYSVALATSRAAYDVAEQSLHREIKKQYPDLQIGPAYEWDEGQNKIGLGAGITLPLLNANRQGIGIAKAERDAARTEYESNLERLISEYRQAQRLYEATRAARESIELDLLPLAEAQIADEQKLAEMGELNVLLTLESVVRVHEVKVQLVEARLAEAQAAYRLEALLGPATHGNPLENEP